MPSPSFVPLELLAWPSRMAVTSCEVIATDAEVAPLSVPKNAPGVVYVGAVQPLSVAFFPILKAP